MWSMGPHRETMVAVAQCSGGGRDLHRETMTVVVQSVGSGRWAPTGARWVPTRRVTCAIAHHHPQTYHHAHDSCYRPGNYQRLVGWLVGRVVGWGPRWVSWAGGPHGKHGCLVVNGVLRDEGVKWARDEHRWSLSPTITYHHAITPHCGQPPQTWANRPRLHAQHCVRRPWNTNK